MSTNPVFDLLANIIASNRLMIFTGSGISNGLLDRNDQPLPGWKNLLIDIADRLGLEGEDQTDFEDLLRGEPSGQEMIEAASILEQTDETEFAALLREKLSPRAFDDQPGDVREAQIARHRAVLDLHPRGILTLNIDCGHASALEKRGELDRWTRINPLQDNSEDDIRSWLSHRRKPLLFEAHGSLADPESGLVFSHRAYRDLLHRTPTYRALLRYLLSEYSFVFVGFGLTDLDFDQFLHEHAMDFGEPLQKHVVIKKGRSRSRDVRQAARYRRRFGICTLEVEEHDDVWKQLQAGASHVGTAMQKTLTLCMGRSVETRREGHRRLQTLGPAGRAIATRHLVAEIERDQHQDRVNEAIYSLGSLRYDPDEPSRREAKAALLDEIVRPRDTERLAHALSVIYPFLSREDLEPLEAAALVLRDHDLEVPPDFPDPDERNPVYLESLILRLRAKYEIREPRPSLRGRSD